MQEIFSCIFLTIFLKDVENTVQSETERKEIQRKKVNLFENIAKKRIVDYNETIV